MTKREECPEWLVPGEEEVAEELVADRFAFALFNVELRNNPDLQPVAFAGLALSGLWR